MSQGEGGAVRGAEHPGGAPPEGLLGEIILLDDVGPIRRTRSHPVARALAGPLLAAAAVLVGGLVALPTLWVVVDAFVTEGGFFGSDAVWGLDNLGAVWLGTVFWVVVVPGLIVLAGMFLAFQLGRRPGPVIGAALVAPAAVPLVVTGVTFRLLFHPDPDRGPATALLGFIPGDRGWLGSGWITISLILAFVWVWLGLVTLVFRAALDRLPRSQTIVPRASGRRWWGSTAAALFRDAYWQPVLRRVAGLLYVLVAVMSVRTLDLILVAAPESVLDDALVLPAMHYQQSGGSAAALGTLWLLALAAVLAAARWTWPAWPVVGHDPGDAASDGHGGGGADRDGDGRRPRAPARSAWSLTGRWPGHFVRPVLIGAWLAPLVVLALTALHERRVAATGGWSAGSLSLSSFGELASTRYYDSLWLTTAITVTAALVAVAVAALAVEELRDLPARAARVAFVAMVAAAAVPVQVIANRISSVLDLVDSATPLAMPEAARLTLVHVSLAVPLCIVVLMAARARAFELARRAWADERERRGPLARSRRFAAAAAKLVRSLPEEPAVITALVLVSLQVWNDFVVGIFFSGPGATPLAVLLHGQARQFVTNSGPLAAGSVVALAAPVALLAACHRRLIDGLVGGASARAPSTGARLEASLP